ncbi:MAG: outer membrane beta-barrel protein [Pseudomonadota bacterium]|nr:outer membrane beta-barrel protein [Pseudomonadota bacterium]
MPVARRLTHAVVIVAGFSMLASAPALAEDVVTPPLTGKSVQAVISETGVYETNPLMVTKGATTLYGSTTSPQLILQDDTPTTQLDLNALVNENLFNESNFDSTDLHVKAGLNKQMQRWGAGIQGATDYDTTRTSELTTYGTNVAPVRHLGVSLTPQTTFAPTAVDKLSLAATAAMSTYQSSVFTDYETFSVNPTYTHTFDPLNSGNISLQAQRYQTTKGPSNKTDSVGPTVGWVGILTPRLTAKANVGVQESRQSGANVTSSSWTLNYIFSGDISFKGQQDVADLNASRAQYPFGNGSEALLTTVALTDIHQLNARLALNVGLSYQTGEYQASANGDLKSLLSANSGLTYHATDHVDVTATYQYRYETLNGVSGNAQDNAVTLGVSYHPKAWGL